MLIQPHPTAPLTKWKWEREWEKHKSLKGIQKHYSFSNCFRHSKYSNISAGLLCLLYSSEVLLGSLWETCWREAKQQGGVDIKGQGQNLGGDEEISLYMQGQVRVHGSQWHQLKFGVGVGVGWGGWGGYFIYHFHFQLDCPPPLRTPPPPAMLAPHSS